MHPLCLPWAISKMTYSEAPRHFLVTFWWASEVCQPEQRLISWEYSKHSCRAIGWATSTYWALLLYLEAEFHLSSPKEIGVLTHAAAPVIPYLWTCILFVVLLIVCAGFSLLHGLFSSCGNQGLLSSCGAQASHCHGFSCCGARALGHSGFSSCSVRTQ